MTTPKIGLLALGSLLAIGAGCSGATSIVFVVDSDLPLAASGRVVLSVSDEDGGRQRDYVIDPSRRDPSGALTFALDGPGGGATIAVHARAILGSDVVASSSLRTRFVPGNVRMVVVPLCARCVDGACDHDDLDPRDWHGTAPASMCSMVTSDGGHDDASLDASLDAAVDVPFDAVDATPDVAIDARDAGFDADDVRPDTVSDVPSDVRVDAGSPDDIVRLATGTSHACAIRRSGEIVCWGLNVSGQLGDGTTTTRPSPAPAMLASDASVVAGGESTTVAIDTSHRMYFWGSNGDGQYGNGTYTPTTSTTPRRVTFDAGTPARAVTSTGNDESPTIGPHSCAVTVNGDLYCWGGNMYGQLGSTSPPNQLLPNLVPGLNGVADVAVGVGFTCALMLDRTVQCFGRNNFGQLGRGTTTDSAIPRAVSNVTDAVQISARGHHVCVRTGSGRVQCWGRNNNGQLGNGNVTNQLTAVNVTLPSGTTARQIAVGYYFTCVNTAGDAYCVGLNAHGQLGISNGNLDVHTFGVSVTHPTGSHFVELSAGGGFVCARRDDAQVVCWGTDDSGQIGPGGSGGSTSNPSPVAVAGLVASTVP